MKKLISVIICLSLMASSCFAAATQHSPGYSYAYNVIRTLGFCDRAELIKSGEEESPESTISKLTEKRSLLESARAIISPYLSNGTQSQRAVADSFIKCIDVEIRNADSNLKFANKMTNKYITEDEAIDATNTVIKEIESNGNNDFWRPVARACLLYVNAELAKPLKPGAARKGKILFNITKAEKAQLKKWMNELWGGKIQDILGNPGKKYWDSKPENNILSAAYGMWNILSSSTWEEYDKKAGLLKFY